MTEEIRGELARRIRATKSLDELVDVFFNEVVKAQELREAAQAVVDFYEVWHRGDDNGYEWWNVIDPLRAALKETS